MELVLWCHGLSSLFGCPCSTLKCQFQLWLFHFQSRTLLVHMESSRCDSRTPVLSNHMRDVDGVLDSRCWLDTALASVVIPEISRWLQALSSSSLFVLPSLLLSLLLYFLNEWVKQHGCSRKIKFFFVYSFGMLIL